MGTIFLVSIQYNIIITVAHISFVIGSVFSSLSILLEHIDRSYYLAECLLFKLLCHASAHAQLCFHEYSIMLLHMLSLLSILNSPGCVNSFSKLHCCLATIVFAGGFRALLSNLHVLS